MPIDPLLTMAQAAQLSPTPHLSPRHVRRLLITEHEKTGAILVRTGTGHGPWRVKRSTLIEVFPSWFDSERSVYDQLQEVNQRMGFLEGQLEQIDSVLERLVGIALEGRAGQVGRTGDTRHSYLEERGSRSAGALFSSAKTVSSQTKGAPSAEETK